jgi:phage terminase large subunit-like protein
MISNTVVKFDAAANMKPDKDKSGEKIDGVVACIMALGRAMVDESPGPSVYETRGVLIV